MLKNTTHLLFTASELTWIILCIESKDNSQTHGELEWKGLEKQSRIFKRMKEKRTYFAKNHFLLKLLCGFQLTGREWGNLETLDWFKYPLWLGCEERLFFFCEARAEEKHLSVPFLFSPCGLGSPGFCCVSLSGRWSGASLYRILTVAWY